MDCFGLQESFVKRPKNTIYYFFISFVLVLSLVYSLHLKKPLKQILTPFFTLLFLTAIFLFFQYKAQSITTPLRAKEGTSLKVVSANIHLESKIDNKLVDYVEQKNADVVVRMPTGAGVGAGPFHSQSNEAWFFHTPGLKIVYPSNPFDAKGLLCAALEDKGVQTINIEFFL